MKKTTLLLVIISVLVLTPMIGCDNDNPDLVEYTNPMENNPVNTLDWLKKVKDEAKAYLDNGNPDRIISGYIKLYTYNEQDYYEVKYGEIDIKKSSSFTNLYIFHSIYDSKGVKCAELVGGDAWGALPGYEFLRTALTQANFKGLLWEYKEKE